MLILGFAYIIFFGMAFFVPKNHINKFFLFIAGILAIIACSVKPDVGMDLYRHYAVIVEFRRIGGKTVFDDILFIRSIYFYLISLTPYNEFLPGITVFCVYYINLNIIYKIGKKYNVSTQYIVMSALLFIASNNFLTTLSGIRSDLAFSIFLYFLYLELVEKKFKILSWLMYLLMCFLHNTMIIFVIFRLFIEIKNQLIIKGLQLLLLLWFFIINYIMAFLGSFTELSIIALLTSQINVYVNLTEYNHFAIIYSSINLLGVLFFYSIFNCTAKNKFLECQYFLRLFPFIIFLLIGSIEIYYLYIRFISNLYLFNCIILMLLIHNISRAKDEIALNIKLIYFFIYVSLLFGNLIYLFTQYYVFIQFGL